MRTGPLHGVPDERSRRRGLLGSSSRSACGVQTVEVIRLTVGGAMLGYMTDLPLPRDLEAPVGELVVELAGHLGERATVDLCVDLLEGADRNDHPDAMPYLTGVVFDETSPKFYPSQWKDYWVRTWGARGLLYVWHDSAAPAVVAGLGDEHWRPAEMCLKVSTRRELGEAGPRAAELAVEGELPRVRVQALRTLGAVGDTEHVDVVRGLLEDEETQVRRQAARSLTQLARRLDLDLETW